MMKRLSIIATSGALIVALAASAAIAQQQDTAMLYFQVETEGEVPQDTTFFGLWGPPNSEFSSVQLTDLDGDGTYNAAAGGIAGPPSTGEYVVRIDQGTTGDSAIANETTPIYGPETITLTEDTTISTSVDFASDSNGEQPDEQQSQCFLPEGCFLSGDGSSETIFGGIGPDYIIGGGGDDWLNGLGGGDWLDGGSGDDLVRGEDGDDLVDGGTGSDFVSGGAGDDYVTGYLGNDRIAGGPGNDFVYAADGQFDVVSGGPDYDVCVVDWFDELTGEATPGHGCEELYFQ